MYVMLKTVCGILWYGLLNTNYNTKRCRSTVRMVE